MCIVDNHIRALMNHLKAPRRRRDLGEHRGRCGHRDPRGNGSAKRGDSVFDEDLPNGADLERGRKVREAPRRLELERRALKAVARGSQREICDGPRIASGGNSVSQDLDASGNDFRQELRTRIAGVEHGDPTWRKRHEELSLAGEIELRRAVGIGMILTQVGEDRDAAWPRFSEP
jgi:hypothetical protein